MEADTNSETSIEPSKPDQSEHFQHVSSVAKSWMADFMFLSVCRYFNDEKVEEFDEMVSLFQAFAESPSLKNELDREKSLICAFLSRVMNGKNLDYQFEEDDSVMPLMSAALIWSQLEETVADGSLFENITTLLFVQSVAVCLKKGQPSLASSALNWFEKNYKLPQSLRGKIKTIVKGDELYHPILASLSFPHLLESVQTYLEIYLKNNPSDDLFQEAAKKVLTSESTESLKPERKQESSDSNESNESVEKDVKKKKKGQVSKRKRKLCPTKLTDVWTPESCKKSHVSIRRLAMNEIPESSIKRNLNLPPPESPVNNKQNIKKRKPPQKWPAELDKLLKDGVKRYGQGKWSRILMEYDFGDRTGVMLKDRWRVLVRNEIC